MVRKAVLAFSARNRRKKVADVLAFVNEIQARDVLLVGAMGEENAGIDDKALDGYVEKQLADHCTIKMGINVVPAVTPYPFQIADARSMPFVDDYADFALANAIIEHVGQEADQRQMVNEMTRVARNWIITTPNKWFPVEAHTSALFKHWSPAWRRKHEREFTRLLSKREFRALLPKGAKISGAPWAPTFTARYSR